MVNLFSSAGYAGFDILNLENGDRLNLKELPPFLRVLLTTDGTVTKSLESYFWEAVNVNLLAQERDELTKEHKSLDLAPGALVVERRVSLSGQKSGRLYALARSLINPYSLPSELGMELENGHIGIGELIRESGAETYRELISIGRDGNKLQRVYRILLAGAPCIEITEQFPLAVYRNG